MAIELQVSLRALVSHLMREDAGPLHTCELESASALVSRPPWAKVVGSRMGDRPLFAKPRHLWLLCEQRVESPSLIGLSGKWWCSSGDVALWEGLRKEGGIQDTLEKTARDQPRNLWIQDGI